ncbi:MAG: DUF5688 family protein [Lachnospiraceae bacterium]|nr:DUF5688 family protein [Lachnospiraceae bacterium]
MKYEEFEQLVKTVPIEAGGNYENKCDKDEGILNYEKIRSKIFYRVISANGNEDLLRRCPHISFYDMAITFRWLFHESELGISSALIEKSHVDVWGIEEKDIIEAAIMNTEKIFPIRKNKILDMIQGWTDIGGPDLPLYVMTNRIGINGASVIFYKDALQSFYREIGQDFYILPSSIHEVLLIGKTDVSHTIDLYDMVWEANHTVVSEREFLSNQVFYYDSTKQKIRIVPR